MNFVCFSIVSNIIFYYLSGFFFFSVVSNLFVFVFPSVNNTAPCVAGHGRP